MATGNFNYDNRCIVVTDDDYEMDNLPPMGGYDNSSLRSYPSRFLAVSDDFDFWDIVITSGYYEAACIDYKRSYDKDVEYFIGATMYFSTKKEFFNECKTTFGLSEYRLRKVCGNVGEQDIETYLEVAYEKLTEYLAEQEEKKVNEYLDGVKQSYGYEEYETEARFSNGETIYRKVS